MQNCGAEPVARGRRLGVSVEYLPPHLVVRGSDLGRKKAPVDRPGPFRGADDEIRTRDPHLGKVMLYQLSHVRSGEDVSTAAPWPRERGARPIGSCAVSDVVDATGWAK